jgi:hypothetical protein
MPPLPIFNISELLSKVFKKKHDHDGDHLSIAEIMHLLHERGFGIMIVLFALPNLFPAFVPPIPTLFAIPLCFFSVQMILRFDAPRLPGIIARRHLKRSTLQLAITKSMPYMQKVESIIRPRMEFMVTDKAERYLGIFMLAFSISVAVPLPMTNFMPSIALLCMGIGILSKDGVAVTIGLVIGVCWIVALFVLGQELIDWING